MIETRALGAATGEHGLAAGDRADDADLARSCEGSRETPVVAHVDTVDVHPRERTQFASLVQKKVGDGQRAERPAHGWT